jgi:hypothetical protein
MIALREGFTEITHEHYLSGILEVQSKKKNDHVRCLSFALFSAFSLLTLSSFVCAVLLCLSWPKKGREPLPSKQKATERGRRLKTACSLFSPRDDLVVVFCVSFALQHVQRLFSTARLSRLSSILRWESDRSEERGRKASKAFLFSSLLAAGLSTR